MFDLKIQTQSLLMSQNKIFINLDIQLSAITLATLLHVLVVCDEYNNYIQY